MKIDKEIQERVSNITKKLEKDSELKLNNEFDEELVMFVARLIEKFHKLIYERLFENYDVSDKICN